jgi:predicted aspartyl protease
MRSVGIFAVLAAACVLASPAIADDQCGKLTLVTSVDMHIGNDGRVYVPVTIDGVSKSMLVDTGGFFTEMAQTTVDELKLNIRHTGLELVGVAGETTNIAARASFKLGSLSSDSMDFMVSKLDFATDAPDAAGIIAPNLLRSYDVDLDFGGKKFNLISQDHCDGQVVYWHADAVAVVPMHVNASGHIIVPVKVDGHPLSALLDTGASDSVMNLDTAQIEFGLTPGAPDTLADGFLSGGKGLATYHHRFKSLEFAGITVGSPQ